MAKVCYFTGRRAETGNTRSHAMNANRRTWKPNLQKVRVLIDGKPKKVWVVLLTLFCVLFQKNGVCEKPIVIRFEGFSIK